MNIIKYNYFYAIRGSESYCKSAIIKIKKEVNYKDAKEIIKLGDEPNPIKFNQDFTKLIKSHFTTRCKIRANTILLDNSIEEDELVNFVLELNESRNEDED